MGVFLELVIDDCCACQLRNGEVKKLKELRLTVDWYHRLLRSAGACSTGGALFIVENPKFLV